MSAEIKEQGSLEALRDSFASFRLLAENVKDNAIYLLDTQGHVATWNSGAELLMQYTAEEIIGKHFSYFYLPEDVAAGKPAAELALALTTGQAQDDSWRKRKDGSLFRANVVISPVYDSKGKHLGFGKVERDVTEQKQASQYARSLIEASLDPLVTISPEGKITDVNAATVKVTGVAREGLIGTDFSVYFTEPEQARMGYEEVFAKGFVTDYPLTIRHVAGQLTDVLYNASVYRDSQGKVLGVFAAARDVTEQKQASQYARSLIEASLDPLVTISPEGKITDVNAATVKVTGVAREGLIGTDFSVYFTEPEQARMGYEEVFAKGFVTDYPLTIRHAAGQLTDVQYNASVYRDSQGKVLGVFAAARDVTLDKREARLRLAQQRAHVGDWERSLDSDKLALSEEMNRIYGLELNSEVDMSTLTGLIHPDDREMVLAHSQKVIEEGGDLDVEYRILRPDGSMRYVVVLGERVLDEAGQPSLLRGTVQDITERKLTEEALRHSKQRMENAQRVAHVGDWEWDIDQDKLAWSDEYYRIFGLEPQSLAPNLAQWIELIHPEDRGRLAAAMRQVVETKGNLQFNHRLLRPDGELRYVEGRGEWLAGHAGQPLATGVVYDVTDRVNEEWRLRSILDNASDAIITVDEDGLVLSFNRAAEELYGYTEAEMNGQEVFILAHEEERAYFADLVQRLCRGEQAKMRGIEGQGRRKDGSIFPLELSLNVFAFGDKQYVIGLYRDTTEQKDKAERLRAILDNASDAIITVDEDGIVQSFNRAAEGLYGYTEAEMNGQEVYILAHEEQRAYFADLVQRLCRGEQAKMRGIEGQGRRKDGSIFPLELSLNVFAFGDKQYVIGLYRDTTEQKDKAERLRAILDNASDAIITVDEDGIVQSFNRAAEGLYGYTEAEMNGQEVYILAHEEQRAYFSDLMHRMCGGDQAQILGIEGQGRRKDGSIFPLELSLNVFAFGDKHYVIGLYRDATQRKKLEEQLRQSQKMEAVGKLAGGVAHDFNNMLAVINGYSGMALRKLNESDPLHEYITEILHAGERAALITSQLLAFSRQLVLAPRVLDLNQVVVETEKMLQRLIGEDISVAASLDPQLSRIRVDQGQIVQVIMNLAVNARDAMPQGGKLTIKTSNFYVDEERARELPDSRPGQHVVLSVSDTGIGMTPEIRQRIFEPFFTTKPPGEGTGLGLATVYGIITQSGGSIEVYSEPGHGTSFRIYFPAIEEDAELHKKPEPVETTAGTETILLVEDDAQVRRVALVLLEEQGYKVLVASGGREALDIARNHVGQIDLLLTDLVMPEMSGRQVAEAIVPLLPGVKVLYMSGYTDDAVVRHGLVTESVAFLQKPFTSTSLPSKVRQVLDTEAGVRPVEAVAVGV